MRDAITFSVSLLAAAALVVLPAVGSAQTATETLKQKAADAKSTTKNMASEAKADITDTWLTAKTKIALFADERVNGRQVSVETEKGTVMLRGAVDTAEAKVAAESVAQGIEGVQGVRNDLQVVPPPAQKMVKADDKAIKKTIADRFAQDPQLKRIDVRSDAGIVTLTGETASIEASARASEIAHSVPAVRAVRNDVKYRQASTTAPGARADVVASRSPVRQPHVRMMQQALTDKGYDPGPVDGIFGPRTSVAVRDYQRAHNLDVTGQTDADTLGELGVGIDGASRPGPAGRPQA